MENLQLALIPVLWVLLLAAVVILTLLWKLKAPKRRIEKNRTNGKVGEERALAFLKKQRYKVDQQVTSKEVIWVDGQKVSFEIRPDIFATKGRENWVIDVKTGKSASINDSSTRRQLREYAAYFPNHRVGLINGDAGKQELQEIVFDKHTQSRISLKWFLWVFAIGIILGAFLYGFVARNIAAG